MPRRNLIRTNLNPYHVTIRSNNRDWFKLPLDEIWRIVKDSLILANKKYPAKIQAFVLMNNHYHLMIWTPNSDLDRFMYILNLNISKCIRRKTNRINRIFGDRYKWTLITEESHYNNTLRYIYQNPLRASLVNRCEDYHYSTLNYYMSKKDFGCELFKPIFGDCSSFRSWVNSNDYDQEIIKTGLRKPIFKKIKCRSSRRFT